MDGDKWAWGEIKKIQESKGDSHTSPQVFQENKGFSEKKNPLRFYCDPTCTAIHTTILTEAPSPGQYLPPISTREGTSHPHALLPPQTRAPQAVAGGGVVLVVRLGQPHPHLCVFWRARVASPGLESQSKFLAKTHIQKNFLGNSYNHFIDS